MKTEVRSQGSEVSAEYAILFLDDLELQQCETRTELDKVVKLLNSSGSRPYQLLRKMERYGRQVWSPRHTNYFDPITDNR